MEFLNFFSFSLHTWHGKSNNEWTKQKSLFFLDEIWSGLAALQIFSPFSYLILMRGVSVGSKKWELPQRRKHRQKSYSISFSQLGSFLIISKNHNIRLIVIVRVRLRQKKVDFTNLKTEEDFNEIISNPLIKSSFHLSSSTSSNSIRNKHYNEGMNLKRSQLKTPTNIPRIVFGFRTHGTIKK